MDQEPQIHSTSPPLNQWKGSISHSNIPVAFSYRTILALLASAIIFTVLTNYTSGITSPSLLEQRVEPSLLTFATRYPQGTVIVTVHESKADATIENFMFDVGGIIIRRSPLAQTITVQLTGRSMLQVAGHPAVHSIKYAVPPSEFSDGEMIYEQTHYVEKPIRSPTRSSSIQWQGNTLLAIDN